MSLVLTIRPELNAALRIDAPRQAVVVRPTPAVRAALSAILGGSSGGNAGINYQQSAPSAEWTINHNLGYRPSVEVFSVGGAEIEADVLHTSLNQTRIYFVTPTAGFARLN